MRSKDIAGLAIAGLLCFKTYAGPTAAAEYAPPPAPWSMSGNVHDLFAYINPSTGTDNHLLGGGGTLLFGLWQGFFMQASGLYYGTPDKSQADVGSLEAVAFWRDQDLGLIGFSGGWSGIDGNDVARVGLRFDIYGADIATIGGSAGVLSGQGPYDGYYLEGGVTFYPFENFALSAIGNYTGLSGTNNDVASAEVRAEYMFPGMLPVSLYGGYRYTDVANAGPNASIFFVGAKFYFGNPGDGTLLGWHRNNAASSLNVSSVPGLF